MLLFAIGGFVTNAEVGAAVTVAVAVGITEGVTEGVTAVCAKVSPAKQRSVAMATLSKLA